MANSQCLFGIRSCYLENIRFSKCSIRLITNNNDDDDDDDDDKLFTSCMQTLMLDHINTYDILSTEQRGCSPGEKKAA